LWGCDDLVIAQENVLGQIGPEAILVTDQALKGLATRAQAAEHQGERGEQQRP
jgi:hypothetical protein